MLLLAARCAEVCMKQGQDTGLLKAAGLQWEAVEVAVAWV